VETGWGRAGESWHTIEEVRRLGGPDWFRLGDLDLASHLVRSHILGGGGTLTEATQHLLDHFGVTVNVWPMTDQPAPTVIETDEGLLSFQTWFVGRQWQPSVRKIKLPDDVRATRQVLTALERADLVIIAPSNPFVSIDPILNVYPIREMIMDLPKLVIAVSPIIAGQAVKGPAAKMMREMAMPVSAEAIADYYGPLLDAFIHDERDEQTLQGDKLPILRTDTLMYNKSDRMRFAKELLNFSTELIET
jgi:LPPG:FO 2-phospho-L-lactate transferase